MSAMTMTTSLWAYTIQCKLFIRHCCTVDWIVATVIIGKRVSYSCMVLYMLLGTVVVLNELVICFVHLLNATYLQ